jgi:hypothetical protein
VPDLGPIEIFADPDEEDVLMVTVFKSIPATWYSPEDVDITDLWTGRLCDVIEAAKQFILALAHASMESAWDYYNPVTGTYGTDEPTEEDLRSLDNLPDYACENTHRNDAEWDATHDD